MAMYRWIYNRTIEFLQKFYSQKTCKFTLIRTSIRKIYNYQKHNYPEWYTSHHKIPSRVLDGAIRTCCSNHNTNISKLQKEIITKFTLKPRCKTENTTITIFGDCFSSKINSFHPTILGPIQSSEKFYTMKHKDSKLQYNPKLNEYLLFVPVFHLEVPMPITNNEIALDVGEKTFLMGYSPKKEVITIGVMLRYRLQRISSKISKLQSKISNVKSKKKRKKLYAKKAKLHARKKNLRDDLHWKSIAFLTNNYDSIILGDMSTQKVCKKIRSKRVKDTMYGLSPYLFKTRLEWKCSVKGRQFDYQDESYSTKTCTRCGFENKPLDRIYKCSKCKLVIHRDVNGARNIWLKWRYKVEKERKKKLKILYDERERLRQIVHETQLSYNKKLYSLPALSMTLLAV